MDHRRGLPAVIVAFALLAFPAGASAQGALGTVTGVAGTAVGSVTKQVPSPAPAAPAAAPVVRQVTKAVPVPAHPASGSVPPAGITPAHVAPRPGPVVSPADTVKRVGDTVERVAPAAAPVVHAITRTVTPVAQPVDHAVLSLTGAVRHPTRVADPVVSPLIASPTGTGFEALTGIGRALPGSPPPPAPTGAVLGTTTSGSRAVLTPAGAAPAGSRPALALAPSTPTVRHAAGGGPATPVRAPSAPQLPGAPSGAMAGPAGTAAFAGFALLFAALVLLPAGALQRLRLAPAMVGPAPFVSLLERPG